MDYIIDPYLFTGSNMLQQSHKLSQNGAIHITLEWGDTSPTYLKGSYERLEGG
jgi:hypothetical protein